MTLNEFSAVIRERIPTPAEFVSVVDGQGWKIVVQADGRASLRVPSAKDRLAQALARMLSREPYRTNVLRFMASGKQEPEPDAKKCPGFTVPIGKNNVPTHIECNTLYWNAADCAETCNNRNCPQRGNEA